MPSATDNLGNLEFLQSAFCNILIQLQKAFDTVDHKILIYKSN